MYKKSQLKGYVCIVGNDGTGKSTMCRLTTEQSDFIGVERSMKLTQDENVKKLVSQIKKLDRLTYSYAFEDDWYGFELSRSVQVQGKIIPVYWVMLCAPVEVLRGRIETRSDTTKYQHEKCVRYFNYVYQQMGYFYGINLVNCHQPIKSVVSEIMKILQQPQAPLAIKNLTIAQIQTANLEDEIVAKLSDNVADKILDQKILPHLQFSKMREFYFPCLTQFLDIKLKKQLVARWIKIKAERHYADNKLHFKFLLGNEDTIISIEFKKGYLFEKIDQGESKMLFQIISDNEILVKQFQKKVIIVLKSTIYSHTKQRTSEISQLGRVRAKGSTIFLEMLKRNNIKHSYICVNQNGIILSRHVQVNMIQVVFKKERLGTDKHSYIGLQYHPQICQKNNCYTGGIYVRFDWRNPNHVCNATPEIPLNSDIFYYVIEKAVGKEVFFSKFIMEEKCKAIGDKCITEDLIINYVDTKKIKQKVIEAYCTFQYYAREVGLQILDGCMMFDQTCQYIWSQINPDCLRVKTIVEREDYDKDIWRAGGSSSKQQIMAKWQTFNQIFVDYFTKNRFMDSEMNEQFLCNQLYAKDVLSSQSIRKEYQFFYRKLIRGSKKRELIATIDIINGEPILVQSSLFKQKHSEGSLKSALSYISILPQVLLVDIDGASDNPTNNKNLIGKVASEPNVNFFAVGGGIRSKQTADSYLRQFNSIVISSNLDIIQEIQKFERKRIIVELSVNEKNQILTHARTVNTGVNVIKKMVELCELGIQIVSITFNNAEGRLKGIPRQQLRNIMYDIPGPIKKVIIAGGISNVSDLQFIWGFSKCVPQLGSAIWKNKISIGEIYSMIVRFNDQGLVPAVIQDRHKKSLGLIYLNKEALEKICQYRYLYRYSRQHAKVMKKGQESGNTQKVLSMNIDCDNDSLLITVDIEHPFFCHEKVKSCFYQNSILGNRKDLPQIQQHILKTNNGGGSGYSYKIQNNQKLAGLKIIEEAEELFLAQNRYRKVEQSADLVAHTLMYLNSQNISIEQISNVLAQRSQISKIPKNAIQSNQNIIKIGVSAGKHNKFVFQFLETHIGVKVLPHIQGSERNYTIKYEVINEELFLKQLNIKSLQEKNVVFISVKPKDLARLLYKKFLHFGINYSNVVESCSDTFKVVAKTTVPGLHLALIKKQGANINPKNWSEKNKGKIVSEYPQDTITYFKALDVPSNHYTLTRVSGHSEGFLVDGEFDYCDAIVLSGKTIKDNHLEIEALLRSEISVILYNLHQ